MRYRPLPRHGKRAPRTKLEPEKVPEPEAMDPQKPKDPTVSEADQAKDRLIAGELTAPGKSADLMPLLWNDGILSAVMEAFGATSATLTLPKEAELPPCSPPPGIFVPGKS